MNYVQNLTEHSTWEVCERYGMKDKDTPESIFFLSFLCMLTLLLLLWDPEGLAGAQRRLVIITA